MSKGTFSALKSWKPSKPSKGEDRSQNEAPSSSPLKPSNFEVFKEAEVRLISDFRSEL